MILTILSIVVASNLTSCGNRHVHQNAQGETELDYEDSIISFSNDSVVQEKDSLVSDSITPIQIKSKIAAVLVNAMKESGHWEEYSAGIIPKIAEYSTEYVEKLLANTYPGFIVVDKSRMKVILFDRFGRVKKSYGMACAKNYGTKHKKADSRTPEGYFSVQGIYDSTDWLFTDDDGVTSKKKGQFGPRFIRLSIPGTTQIGIHGTCAPWSIGGRSSHGCIRITNEHILELVELVEPGMPVIIVPGKKDLLVNKEEGVDIPWIPTVSNAKEPKIDDTLSSPTADTIPVNQEIAIDSVAARSINDTITKSEDKISIDN